MLYKTVELNTAAPKEATASILLIYTGGTLGMVYGKSGALEPFNFERILEHMPSLQMLDIKLRVISFEKLIDSSNAKPEHWQQIGRIIYENYTEHDGFVVVHGTDTMAYTASALSFMLEGLSKPVIFTGAQLPIGALRSDARENLITAIEIAATRAPEGGPRVAEVGLYFDSFLLRGNRAKKVQSIHFDAFESENYPALAEAGVIMDYNTSALMPFLPERELKLHENFDTNVVILKLFPGISQKVVESILSTPGLKGVVLETYGSGNAPTEKWFIEALKKASDQGILLLNVSQCNGGRVIQGRYRTSEDLEEIGVLSGNDMTIEAAVTKMMFLLAKENEVKLRREKLVVPLAGEMTK
jgi:L-asparaginase